MSKRINNLYKKIFEADEEANASKSELDAAAKDPEIQKKIDAISKSLKDAGLVEYVASVNDMMADEKGRLALELVAGTLSDDQLEELGLKNVKFKFVQNAARLFQIYAQHRTKLDFLIH